VLLADYRAANRDPLQGGPEEEVDQRLALGPQPGAAQPFAKLVPGQRSLVGQRALDHRESALHASRVDALLREPGRARGHQRRGQERVEPRVVLAGDQVQRAAVQ